MAKRARLSLVLIGILIALVQFSGCADKPATFNAVLLTPNKPQIIAQNTTVSITASVLNDTAGMGVTFALNVGAVGTITQTSSTTATYFAPVTIATAATDVVTVTSVDFPKSFATLSITVEPPPLITTTSLPTATLNAAYTGPVAATGGVPPLMWTIASGTLPAGLSLAASKTDTVNITGTPTAAGASTVTIMITDAVGESNTSGPLTIVVSNLAITTTSPLPAAVITTPPTLYSEQFSATGGTGADTWSVATGSVLPPGLTLSAAGLLSGDPTTPGNYSFGITVTDSGTPPAVITGTFTLVVSPPQDLTLLNGRYVYTFSGYNASGFVAFAGMFNADGNGNLTAGVEDFNSEGGTPQNYTNITGTYTLGTDGRGTLTFATNSNGAFNPVPTYAFAIDVAGQHGRLIEFDTSGIRGSGRIELTTIVSCTVNLTGTTYVGDFAVGGAGHASSFTSSGEGPTVFAGRFTASPPLVAGTSGSLGNGEFDYNAPNNVSTAGTLSGTYANGSDANRCLFSLQSSLAGAPLNYSVYPVTPTDAFLVEIDPVNGVTPYLTVGEIIQQQDGGGGFPTGAVLSGNMAGALNGHVLSGTYIPDVSLVQLAPQTGAASFNMSFIDNEAGTVLSTNGNPIAVTYSSDTLGRVAGAIQIDNFVPVCYIVSPDEAFCIGILPNAPTFGHLFPQEQPVAGFTLASLDGPYVQGTAGPGVAADNDLSGFLSFDGNGNITGTQDISTSAANTSALAVTGTYVLTSSGATDGSGTLSLTAPTPAFSGAYFIISPTQAVMITTTSGDSNPVVFFVGSF
jgi:large repetitive protein